MVILKQWYSQGDSCPPLRLQGRAQKFEKGGGGRCNFLFLFPPKIPVKTKKRSSRLSTSNLPPKSSEDQKKGGGGHRVLRCTVSTGPLTGDIYQLIF